MKNPLKPVPETMQALVLSGRGFESLQIKTVDVPRPGPNQLLARVDAAGVCTSILKILDQGADHSYFNGWDPEKWPVILGDEGALTLVEIGSNLKSKYKVGERYGLQPAVDVGPINHHERYRNQAKSMQKTAVGYTLGGQLAEYILIQEEVLEGECLLPLPDENMGYFEVSMAEPISCIISAQDRHVHFEKTSPKVPRQPKLGVKKGGICVLLGAGGMGKIHAEYAISSEPAVLIVSDPIKERLDWVNRVLKPKADKRNVKLITTNPNEVESVITRASNGLMANDIIFAIGHRKVQQEALNWLAKEGIANAFGGLKKGDSILEVDAIRIHYDEIKLVGSSGGDPADYLQTLQAIHSGNIDAGNYVAGVSSLDKAVDVLKGIARSEIQGKVILYPHLPSMDIRWVDYWSREDEAELLAMKHKL